MACRVAGSAGLADLVDIDGVDLAQEVGLLLGDVARDADGDAGTGEWMTVHQVGRQAELAHLVLEQLAQGLDQLPVHALGQAAEPPYCRMQGGAQRFASLSKSIFGKRSFISGGSWMTLSRRRIAIA